MRQPNYRLLSNFGILLLGFFLGLFNVFGFSDIKTDLLFMLFVLVLGVAAVIADCFFRSRAKKIDQEWLYPSMRNPISFVGQPIQTSFVGSMSIICIGIGLCIHNLFNDSASDSYLLFLSGGIGGFLGAIFCAKIFTQKAE